MKRFKKVYVEITNVCNLSCEFCPKTTRAPKSNNEKDFSHILEAVKAYTDHIYLHLLGEPTMHPKLEEYLQMSYEHKLKVNLTTNGTLMGKVQEILIGAKALRQVNISLHSFEGNEQASRLEEYIDEVAHFINEATKRSKIICSLRLWNMDSETLKAKNTMNQRIVSRLEEKLGLAINLEEAIKQNRGIKLKNQVYLNMAERFEWPDQKRESLGREIFCYGLRDQIGILVDGTVVPCCLDSEGHIALGNIFETPLEEILASERSKALYEGFSNRVAVEPLCQRCGYAMRY